MRPIAPREKEYYSFAIAFVSRRTIGTPFLYNTTLNKLQLKNPFGYKIKVYLFTLIILHALNIRIYNYYCYCLRK